jgi:prophage tail gpP-like protein
MSNGLGDLTAKLLASAKGLPDDTVKLAVGGKFYEGWTGVTIKRSIKTLSGSYDLSVITKWDELMTPWDIVPGESAILLIGKEKLISGYVDETSPELTKEGRTVSVNGRDTSADLVDCSIDTPASFASISLKALAKRLCDPFGVGVTVDASAAADAVHPFPSWKVNHGESAFESLDRAAKQRGVLLMNDGNGNLVITRPSKLLTSTQLVQGQNILAIRAHYSMKERFSKYTVKSQNSGLEADGAVPGVDFSCKGTAVDQNVKRFRPLLIIAEGNATAEICRKRAQWEASVRVGKSTSVQVTVPGWRQVDGSLWAPNRLCRVNAPAAGINIDLLITEVTLHKTVDSTTSEITLEPASAYTPDPTLDSRKEALAQLVKQESKRK